MVKVIELPAAASRYGFAARNGGSSSRREEERAAAPRGRKEEKPMMLRTAKRDVFEYGTTGLSKRAKRVVEAERKEAFGVKVKGEKMPLKMVRGIRRAEAKRMEKEKEERKVAGVVTARERRDRLTRKRTSKKRKRGIDDELKDGILRLN